MERNYKEDIKIDLSNLEDEWILQPSLYLTYSELHADAIAKRDNAKLKLEYVHAKIDSDIRKNLKKYGFTSKPTEAAIKSAIILDKKHKKAEKTLINANKEVNVLNAVKLSFEHRKAALQNVVSLKVMGLSSEPRNLVQDAKYKKKRVMDNHKAQKDKLNKRRENKKSSSTKS